ncbi:hypothetical protein CJD36_007600 [Flavipsychrobacter stenotrophus]|uniref:protein-tyrosine-phosphatase n=1 Tax=Flavipsychrobacter stenotrophus TaxID=2077091 RepID=A0A2S7SXJ4_9BACT|nr:CpsB/CapC family capsule biosynthesis tyrosine phosphatase [Flavipsychrobacter stenotrophus]PQJ11652.1 hypothetical protein CJD36_007600 [Flavipsychrobacter stenotrophus]
MFSRFFKREKSDKEKYNELPIPENASFSFLGADMHSHLVPGIDDGAKTIEDSLFLLRSMEAMGYTHVTTTPHIMIDFYPNTRNTILSGLDTLRQLALDNDIKLNINAAAEYYIDEYFADLVGNEPLLTVYKNEVLVEFSMMYEPPMLNDVLFNMQANGYRPILAHPERYTSLHNNFDRFLEFKDRGCLLQLNLLSLTGYYGGNIMNTARRLLDKGLYDYCGSDMHHERHAAAMSGILKTGVYNTLVNYPFLNSKLCL